MPLRPSILLILCSIIEITHAFILSNNQKVFGISSPTSLSYTTEPSPATSFHTEEEIEKEKKYIYIYDTTLRDGTQGESVSVSCEDKLKILSKLDSFKVDFIEAGWPGSNPKDVELFDRCSSASTDKSVREKLVAFGSTRRKGIKCIEDPQIKALLESNAKSICMVAKAHLWQVHDILRTSAQENLDMIYDSISYLKKQDRTVFLDLEHAFDGYNYNHDYFLQCCQVAVDAGVDGLVLCDTNGGSMPWQIEEITKTVVKQFPSVIVGIHCHNDCGMAVANSLMAVKAGATMVQGTINGIGERTGNADLCSIVPSLLFHMEYDSNVASNIANLTKVSRYIDEVLNRNPNPSSPYVGQSAFAHKGGLHVSALQRNDTSYQHIDPTLVGNEKRILISELSGRQNIMNKLNEANIEFESDKQRNERAMSILKRVKDLEAIGYTFEGADASVHLMILHMSQEYCAPFRVLDYSASVSDYNLDSASRVIGSDDIFSSKSRATVLVRTVASSSEICDETAPFLDRLEVSDGNGPVNALSKALIKALEPSYPILSNIELVDYKVRILDPESATGATTRVMIEFKNKETEERWTTVSVDPNVISASLNALIDGFEYALLSLKDLECLMF